VDFSGDVALEAAEDFLLRFALGDASLHVQLGVLVGGQAGEGDLVQRTVRVAVTPAVALLLAGGCVQRCRTGQVREGPLVGEPFGLSPAVTSSAAAVWVPTPFLASRSGAVSATRRSSCTLRRSICSVRCW
jgi:hypothetical protein